MIRNKFERVQRCRNYVNYTYGMYSIYVEGEITRKKSHDVYEYILRDKVAGFPFIQFIAASTNFYQLLVEQTKRGT